MRLRQTFKSDIAKAFYQAAIGTAVLAISNCAPLIHQVCKPVGTSTVCHWQSPFNRGTQCSAFVDCTGLRPRGQHLSEHFLKIIARSFGSFSATFCGMAAEQSRSVTAAAVAVAAARMATMTAANESTVLPSVWSGLRSDWLLCLQIFCRRLVSSSLLNSAQSLCEGCGANNTELLKHTESHRVENIECFCKGL